MSEQGNKSTDYLQGYEDGEKARWIPVSESLPAEDGWYLVAQGQMLCVRFFSSIDQAWHGIKAEAFLFPRDHEGPGVWHGQKGDDLLPVTCWMPLPPLPG